jgi:DNA modification methylase
MTYCIHIGDCIASLRQMPDQSVHTCVTSPPYFGLRDYGHEGQIGLESTPEAFVARLVEVFREVRRVLRDDGTLWLNLGDSYAGGGTIGRNDAGRDFTGGGGNRLGTGNPGPQGVRKPAYGLKQKDLIGIPWRVAFALQADGWYLRQDIIWHKPNPMPESVRDRCTKAHEYIFMLSKGAALLLRPSGHCRAGDGQHRRARVAADAGRSNRI